MGRMSLLSAAFALKCLTLDKCIMLKEDIEGILFYVDLAVSCIGPVLIGTDVISMETFALVVCVLCGMNAVIKLMS